MIANYVIHIDPAPRERATHSGSSWRGLIYADADLILARQCRPNGYPFPHCHQDMSGVDIFNTTIRVFRRWNSAYHPVKPANLYAFNDILTLDNEKARLRGEMENFSVLKTLICLLDRFVVRHIFVAARAVFFLPAL